MTIDQYLRKKANAFVWPILGLIVLGVILRWSGLIDSPYGFSIALAIFVTMLLAFLVLWVRFRCPRCTAPMSSLVAHFGPFRKLGRPVICCPFCTVRLDEAV